MFAKKRILQLCAAMVLIIAACLPVSAQGLTLQGSWLVSITLDNTPGPFAIDMAVFDAQGSYRIIPSSKAESEGTGAYQRLGGLDFRSTHTQVLYDAQGNFAGVAKVIATETLANGGDTFTGRFRVDILDATGTVIPGAGFTGSVSARRVVPQPL
jgi:hypothetical protein